MLAALQFNENGMREQATTKEGKKDMTSCFPSIKKRGGGGIHTSESESGVYIWKVSQYRYLSLKFDYP